ncbi:MAG: hypothetical protein V9E82_12780 [Candidatus Nanopelagicales bacterium]
MLAEIIQGNLNTRRDAEPLTLDDAEILTGEFGIPGLQRFHSHPVADSGTSCRREKQKS